ncbi:MAG: serine/threonine protein kinase [Candidatus Xenobia bacterium]
METYTPDAGRFEPVGILQDGRLTGLYLMQERESGRHLVAHRLKLPPGMFVADARTAALREAQRFSTIQHPRLPVFVECIPTQGGIWYLFEQVEGHTAEQYLAAKIRIPSRWCVLWISHALAALEYLQARPNPIVIGCLDPAGIVVGEQGAVVVELGLYRKVFPESAALYRSEGHPAFAAPEQRNSPLQTPVGDVFSVGAVGYQLLVGEPPPLGTGSSTDSVDTRVAFSQMDAALRQARPNLPDSVRLAVLDMLAFYPSSRLQSAQQAGERLRPGLRELPQVAAPQPPQNVPPPAAVPLVDTGRLTAHVPEPEPPTARVPRADAVTQRHEAAPEAPPDTLLAGALSAVDDWSWMLFRGDARKLVVTVALLMLLIGASAIGYMVSARVEQAREDAIPSLMTVTRGRVLLENVGALPAWIHGDRVTHPGSMILSQRDDACVLQTVSGSTLRLDDNTLIRCGPRREVLSLTLLHGRIWMALSGDRATVSVPGGTVTAPLSTVVELDARNPARVLVSARQGSLTVESARTPLPLSSGQWAVVVSRKAPELLTTLPADDTWEASAQR